jgi:subtilisin family serine protease
MADRVLLFVTYKAKEQALDEIRELLKSRTTEPLDLHVAARVLRKHLGLSYEPPLRGMPSYDFVLALDDVHENPPLTPDDTFVYALDTMDPDSREVAELLALVGKSRTDSLVRDVHVAIDLPTGRAAHVWCPMEGTFPLFGDLSLALTQMRAGAAASKGALGQDVNVVMIDQGINKNVLGQRVPGAKFVGGWSTPEFDKGGPPGPFNLIPPGEWRDDGLGPTVTHGTKMASLVLAVAPHARILDLALLPSQILNLRGAAGFLSWAVAAYLMLVATITWLKRFFPAYRGPWVLGNSWAVYNLSTDFAPGHVLNYGSNPNHPLNLAVAAAPLAGIDVVFAAGNCGQFCPDSRCGAGQIGPARSIYGVAALHDVLTVAAVRSDETWLGYSSQGPADPIFGSIKPDLCAPSQFAAGGDWNRSFTGTSSACALTAGAVAARRSLVPPATESPRTLRARAVTTARLVMNQAGQDDRRGAGMIDVASFV